MSEKETPKPETRYEQIVIAAREARRLNALRIRSGLGAGDSKVTSEALRRTERGEVDWRVATESEAAEEAKADRPPEEDPSFGD